ncbi:MAG: ATP-binding protein [Breznakibacter sp.]
MNHKIRIQYILLLNLLIVLVVLVVFVWAIQWFGAKHRGHLIDQNVELANRRIKTIVDMQSDYKYKIVNDYSYWDEMVNFILRKRDAWGQKNIVPLLETYGFDFAMVYDATGTLMGVYTKRNELEVINLVPDVLCAKLIFKTGNFHWYTNYGGNTYEMFGATVHPTFDADKLTPPKGLLIGGNIMDKGYLDTLAYLTDAKVSLSDRADPEIDEASSEKQLAMWQLNNIDGHAIRYLHFTKKPEFLGIINLWAKSYWAVLVVCVAAGLFIYFFALAKWVGKPLNLIRQALDGKMDSRGKLADLSKYGTEFASIGQLIQLHSEQQHQLAVLKDKAEESDRLKSMFLANMSHEIRTPINGIVGFSELICQEEASEEAKQEYRKVIDSCSHDLMHIIDDIIEISKIEAGVVNLVPREFSLSQMLFELEALYARQITLKEKNIRLIVQKPVNDVILWADGHRLRQMLGILLDNSVKFTNQGHVELTYKMADNWIQFKVKDSGIGIKREKRDVIFDLFRQADEQMARAHGGNGLGLAIFKKLADMMQGKVIVESEEAKGTSFKLRIPVVIPENVDHDVLETAKTS